MSADSGVEGSIKERAASRFSEIVRTEARAVRYGMAIIATIGATAPFVGLFGTVWGIMNSFIGISNAHTTNLAVVAPGIAEALLATAIGLVAAIPAVIIYNHFSRVTKSYLDTRRTRLRCDRAAACRAISTASTAEWSRAPRSEPWPSYSAIWTTDDDDFDEAHDINVTPFIDVMLVLLIIFMVAAPLSTVDLPVNLPILDRDGGEEAGQADLRDDQVRSRRRHRRDAGQTCRSGPVIGCTCRTAAKIAAFSCGPIVRCHMAN